MTETEALAWLRRFERFQPAYARWRNTECQALSAQHGETTEFEAREMFRSLARTMSLVTATEADAALAAMESGRLEIPPFGQLGLAVRGWAVEERLAKRTVSRYDADREPRYLCLNCRDTGLVEVINPYFVEWFRSRFEELQEARFPNERAAWRAQARSDWLQQDRGPMVHSALCNCDCPRTQALTHELALFRKNDRRLKGAVLGPPACGNAKYDPRTMPLYQGASVLRETLAQWYATHEPNQTYEWEPSAEQYGVYFGDKT